MDYIVYLLASFLAVMVVITLHEFSHAFVAYKCGDPTAKFNGRMTLNPVKHFDPLGIVMFALRDSAGRSPCPSIRIISAIIAAVVFGRARRASLPIIFRLFCFVRLRFGLENTFSRTVLS